MQKFYKALDKDKIEINWNNNPIPMELFLSFLTVETERQKKFLGSDNGWTLLTGDNGLEIGGGIIKGTEYLNRLKYGKNLDNSYNNYVNPFYLFDIMANEGKIFFLQYYAEDINAILAGVKRKYVFAKAVKKETSEFWGCLRSAAKKQNKQLTTIKNNK
jgi:hypothetical protein